MLLGHRHQDARSALVWLVLGLVLGILLSLLVGCQRPPAQLLGPVDAAPLGLEGVVERIGEAGAAARADQAAR